MKHTPGPWSRNIKPARKYNIVFAGRNTHVAAIQTPHGMTDDEVEANCNLVTAAPDMFAALKWAMSKLPDDGSPTYAAALETIWRAEGRI